ncbi:uncharacterized protein A4U43_C04F1230 [Asparagus officinalis]|uniref:Uncharacterized protein n=1 Tax=Asparagus officinalis TaxID=4686 RepID=A0A5P1F1U6_ASPOF|nr:uncharacterized protein A4U43_C04F1230 [Asparagus officinalis]
MHGNKVVDANADKKKKEGSGCLVECHGDKVFVSRGGDVEIWSEVLMGGGTRRNEDGGESGERVMRKNLMGRREDVGGKKIVRLGFGGSRMVVLRKEEQSVEVWDTSSSRGSYLDHAVDHSMDIGDILPSSIRAYLQQTKVPGDGGSLDFLRIKQPTGFSHPSPHTASDFIVEFVPTERERDGSGEPMDLGSRASNVTDQTRLAAVACIALALTSRIWGANILTFLVYANNDYVTNNTQYFRQNIYGCRGVDGDFVAGSVMGLLILTRHV